MNRNLKKIVAIALTVSAFSAIAPATNLNINTTKAYASSGDLTSIKLKDSNGGTVKTYSEDDYKSKNQIDDDELENNETYYAKTSFSQMKISTKGVSSSYVRVFKGKSSSSKGVKISSTIELSAGSTTTLTVRTYDEDPGTVKYSDDSYSSQYIIKVKCTANSSASDEEENGDVYLKSISLSDGDLSFSKSTSAYNVNVAESISKITITSKPDCNSDEYDNYKVEIDGTTVDENDKFKRSVSLNKGKNEIKIIVEDDNDEKRTYILNITRGQTTTTNSGNNEATDTTNVKVNQWVAVNGRWQYYDSTGKPLKSSWAQNYYLLADGYMATSWQYIDGYWYYFAGDGTKRIGWQLISGSWYHLDNSGRMQTGWIKDIDGKYYYLYTNGSMAYNTTISGYKLGANGAWIR